MAFSDDERRPRLGGQNPPGIKVEIGIPRFRGWNTYDPPSTVPADMADDVDNIVYRETGFLQRRHGSKQKFDMGEHTVRVCEFEPIEGHGIKFGTTDSAVWPVRTEAQYPVVTNYVPRWIPQSDVPLTRSGSNKYSIKVPNVVGGVNIPGFASASVLLFPKKLDLTGKSIFLHLTIGAAASWNPSSLEIRLHSSATGSAYLSKQFDSTNLIGGASTYTWTVASMTSVGGGTASSIRGITLFFNIGAGFVAQTVELDAMYAFESAAPLIKEVGSVKAFTVARSFLVGIYGAKMNILSGALSGNPPQRALVVDDRMDLAIVSGIPHFVSKYESKRFYETGIIEAGLPQPTQDAFHISNFLANGAAGNASSAGSNANQTYCITYEDDYGQESNASPRKHTNSQGDPGSANITVSIAPTPRGVKKVNVYRGRVFRTGAGVNQFGEGPWFFVGTLNGSSVEQTLVDAVGDGTVMNQTRTAPSPIGIPPPYGYGFVPSTPIETQFTEINDSSLPIGGDAAASYSDRLWIASNLGSDRPIGGFAGGAVQGGISQQ